MKRIFVILLVLALSVVSRADLRVSLLTCGSSDSDVASSFGHSAIRVTDSRSNTDIVFNYGTYNFYAPHFVLKFLRGEMVYMLTCEPFDFFFDIYRHEQRDVVERILNLDEDQKTELYNFLWTNARPEHRDYYYDYLVDNCATRVRDLFSGEDFSHPEIPTETTYRMLLRECLPTQAWLCLGIDLVLGSRIDAPIDNCEQMFLPSYLENNLLAYRNVKTDQALLAEPEVLYKAEPREGGAFSKLISPIAASLYAIALFVLLMLVCRNRKTLVRVYGRILYTLLALGSLIILLLWFCTSHQWCVSNWNLLWLNPLFLLLPWIPAGRFHRVLVYVCGACLCCVLFFWWALPQVFNVFAFPVCALTLLVTILQYHYDYRLIKRIRTV
ncbi:MAG: DUF4105 domain-containing protein [Bacteroidales bacterium]|nr:DUF4105 domain-containing protein [Bacteroidales bacterium]